MARPLHCMLRGPEVGSQNKIKGISMFTTFNSARNAATLAGAFITALLRFGRDFAADRLNHSISRRLQ